MMGLNGIYGGIYPLKKYGPFSDSTDKKRDLMGFGLDLFYGWLS